MKKTKRIVAVLLSVLMLVSAFSAIAVVFAAAPDGDYEETLGMGYIDYQPIPMLVIKINFDADGDGKDCYELKNEAGEREAAVARYFYETNELIYNSQYKAKYGDKPAFAGEQYCYSPDEYWAKMCFGDERGSLNDYYKYISNDEFYWLPVEETSGTVNDGVITVTIKAPHPGSTDTTGLKDANERKLAIEAADEFVDFSKYDKDGNGELDFTELSITYIYGGNEISYNVSSTVQNPYNTHAHVSKAVFGGLKCDGVGVWSNGAQPYVRMGEYGGGSKNWSQMGKLAHELGHVLGAKDLYINSSSWIGGCGELSLMGGGSGGENGTFSAPTVLDPFYKVLYGFAKEEVASAETKEYTLYSHESTKGDFNVIRVNTLNPREYFLIENRSHANDGYDNNKLNGNMQGILIWHIDESIIGGSARPNNGDEGHAAGFTIISPTNKHYDVEAYSTWSSASPCGTCAKCTEKGAKDPGTCTNPHNVFVASNEAQYKFPVSTPNGNANWYTSMTAEQAAQCNIKIEFLTEAGDEMKIRISGANELPAEFTLGDGDRTQTSMTVAATVSDFNGAAVTGCKIYFANNKNFTDAIVVDATKTSAGKYSASFDGLTPSTEYYYKAEITTDYGMSSRSGSAFTRAIPVEDTTATITIVVNGDVIKTTSQNIKIGNQLRINFPLTRAGYTFAGWYLDEAYTQPYEIAAVESADDFTIYAKWTENAPAQTTPGNTETNDGSAEPPSAAVPAPANDPTVVIVIAVVAAVLVGGGVAAVVISSKLSKKNKKQ